jgi:hypothetical protein
MRRLSAIPSHRSAWHWHHHSDRQIGLRWPQADALIGTICAINGTGLAVLGIMIRRALKMISPNMFIHATRVSGTPTTWRS